jgi:hypothetical protein
MAAGDSGWAQNTLDAQALKLYGGTYSADCSNPSATRLRVVADALMVEQGNKRLTGNNVQAAYSYFGQSSPPKLPGSAAERGTRRIATAFHSL